MQDRNANRSTKPSCNARPDHTFGSIAPFRAHCDRGCLPPTTGPKRPGVGDSESGQDNCRHYAVAVRANMRSVLVAMMKSFSCSPLIFLVCKETVALPQPSPSPRLANCESDVAISASQAIEGTVIT